MKIHIRATGKFTPKSNRPTFEYWIDDEYQGEMYEAVVNISADKIVEDEKIKRVDEQ